MPPANKENALKAFIVSLSFPFLYWFLMTQFIPIIYAFFSGMKAAQVQLNHSSANTQNILSFLKTTNALYFYLAASVIFLFITAIIFKARHRNFFERIMANPIPKQILAIIIVLAVGQTFISDLFNFVFPQSWIEVYMSNTDYKTQTYGLVFEILVIGIITPIAEETAFRGLMITRLTGRMAAWQVVVLSVLTFAISHASGSIAQAIAILPMAVIVCLVFLWTKSIYTAILIHMINNIIASISGAVTTTGSVSLLDFIISLIGLVITIITMKMIYVRRVAFK